MSVAVHLILQLGYFKAKRQFFAYERRETVEDIGYILNQHFAGTDLGAIKTPSRPIQVQFRQTILNLFDYRHCDGKTKVELEQKVLRHARDHDRTQYASAQQRGHRVCLQPETPHAADLQLAGVARLL